MSYAKAMTALDEMRLEEMPDLKTMYAAIATAEFAEEQANFLQELYTYDISGQGSLRVYVQ